MDGTNGRRAYCCDSRIAAVVNVNAIVDECMRRLARRYRVVGGLLAGSAAQDPERAQDVDLCVLVHEEMLQQLRWEVDGVPVDVFVCGVERARRELRKGLQQYLVRFFATGTCIGGERGSIENLQALAREKIGGPAPAPREEEAAAFRSHPYNLLRKFEDVRVFDAVTAGLIVAMLVRACVDGYFALNRIWTAGIRERVDAIRRNNRAAADALERVVRTPLDTLRENPQTLRDMVDAFVGETQI